MSLLLYKDARADMKILDEVFGMTGWQRKHEVIGGNLYCTVSIWDGEKKQWISKMDVGTVSYAEKEKGQASDSFKRACVSLGIGRELYTAPFIWVPASKVNLQKKGDKYSTYDKFSVREIAYNEKREISALSIIKQDGSVVYSLAGEQGRRPSAAEKTAPKQENSHVETINRELERTGVALDAVLERYGVSSIAEMSEATYKKAVNSLKKTKSKEAA
ncbi:MAG: Rad52/Rad22 family DNA repair protein [Ruminococcus flavefaciens]|nr:Rad52/Rad22 family DNA repair protein [Ruminococcus flavefaciens]